MSGFFHDPNEDQAQWVFGSTSQITDQPLQADRNWLPFASPELQNARGYDPLDCASVNTERAYQILIKRIFGEDAAHAERWLAYKIDTHINAGADPHKAVEYWRRNGIPDEALWPSDVDQLDFYIQPPTTLDAEARRFLTKFSIRHDTVRGLDAMWDALQFSPLGCSVGWNTVDENGYWYKKGDGPDTHWSVIVGGEYGKYWLFLDSAEPVLKKARWDMSPQLVKRYSITKVSQDPRLSLYRQILLLAAQWLGLIASQSPKNAPTAHETPSQAPEPSQPIHEAPGPFKWATPKEARHSVRLICDQEKLSLKDKNLITAVINAESGFKNTAICRNKNKQGKLISTDWGICQINDTPGWHIGPGLPFPSVEYLLAHPDQAVRYMIKMHKAGKLGLWVAYKNGSYKKYL